MDFHLHRAHEVVDQDDPYGHRHREKKKETQKRRHI